MIPDQDKTREQLIAELNELRRKVNFFPQPESAGSPGETRQTIEILKENEERFKFIADSTCDWESWVGPDGKVMWINPAVEKITGYSREEYLNMPDRLKHIIFDDDQDRILSHFENGIKHHKSANDVDFRIRCKDGSLKWVSVSYQSMYTDGGECLGLRSSIRDIHKRKKVEEQLLAANVFLDALMENLPVAVFVKETKELKYVYWNTACESQIGVLKQDIIGKTDYDVFSKEIADHLTAMDRLAAETGELLNIPEELVNVPFKGTSFFHTKKVPLLNHQGLPAFILGIAENITEQKQIQSALRESEEKYRTLLNDATDAILLADAEGNIFESNKQAEKLLGYTAQELTGINFAQLHIEQERDSVVNLVKTTLLPQGTWSLPAVQLKKKDGTPVPVDITGTFVEYAGKRLIQSVVRDISERKAVEAELATYRWHLEDVVKVRTAELTTLNMQLQREIEEHNKTEVALRRSEEQFRTVVETCSDAIVTVDSSGNIVLWNKGAESLYGYQAQEILGKSFLRIIAGDMQENHRQYFTQFLAERKPGIIVRHGQLRARRKDGSEFPSEGSAALWETSDGVFITSLIRDISERKQSEELLKQSEERFRNLAQSAIDGIVITDGDRRIIFWNKAAERIFGYSEQEVLGKKSTFMVPEEQRARDEDEYQYFLTTGVSPRLGNIFETIGLRKNGTTFPAEVSFSTWQARGKNFYCVVIRDATERKRSDYVIRKVNKCLLSFSADPDKNIQSIVETAGMIFDGAGASYFKKQADAVYIAMAWNLPARYKNLPPFNAQNFDKLFASGADQPLILNRRNILRSVTKDSPMLQMGFESFIATPVKLRNTFIGSLNVAFHTAKTFSPSELNIFSILAKAVSIEEERKSVLEELKQNQLMLIKSRKSLKAFSGRILAIREEEKKNISSALHDELGTMVVALSSGLTIAREEIIESSLEPALKSIERTEAALKQAVENLKKIIIDLRPPDLEIVGLSSALRSLCTTIAHQTNIAADCSVDVADKTIDEDTAITLYRSVQEAVNNVLKHARAKNVIIRLYREKNKLKLSITDDGRGFDIASLDADGRDSTKIGIQGIRERVAALNGTFSLQSAPQKGTALIITIPAKKRRRP